MNLSIRELSKLTTASIVPFIRDLLRGTENAAWWFPHARKSKESTKEEERRRRA